MTLRQLRSLNAATSIVNGASFDGSTAAQMPPPGGGLNWNVFVSGSSPSLTYQIQGQLIDLTWVPVSNPSYSATASVVLSGTLPTNQLAGQFFGPFINMRVAITAYTSGSLTADIVVEF